MGVQAPSGASPALAVGHVGRERWGVVLVSGSGLRKLRIWFLLLLNGWHDGPCHCPVCLRAIDLCNDLEGVEKMNGPCLCGDPYCPSCGNPHLALLEEAETWAINSMAGANLSPDEYRMVVSVGLAAVHHGRRIAKRAEGGMGSCE